MIKRIAIVFISLLLIASLGYLYITRRYHFDKNAILTQIKPPDKNVASELPLGSDLNKPFNLPDGFRLAVYTDLNIYGTPRVLTHDINDVLFTSLTKQGKVIALPDGNEDGIADQVVTVLSGLKQPHGIHFNGGYLYVAETNKVTRWKYSPQVYKVSDAEVLFVLPEGGRHFTRTIKLFEDKIYTSVGSSCDVCEENDDKRSTLLQSNLDGSGLTVFASGLRNTVFFNFDGKGRIWGSDMGRDFLGDNLPPDELNIISEGKNYGWPWCFGNNIYDNNFKPEVDWLRSPCEDTQPTVFDFPAHVAPLGTTFIKSDLFSAGDNGDLLVAFHGSWNSSIPVGYKIVKLEINDNQVLGMQDFITGFINEGDVVGRPVDLAFNSKGLLYISDDKANLIYILTKE